MSQSHFSRIPGKFDVSHYVDNEGNAKEMDHCNALQLELDYFELYNDKNFKSYTSSLLAHYDPAQHPPQEKAKYQCACNKIKIAAEFLSKSYLREPYLKRLTIYAQFKKNESNDFECKDNIKYCFSVSDVHLDEKIFDKLGDPERQGRVGLLSKTSGHFYFETTNEYKNSNVKEVGEKLKREIFPNDPENWVVFYITNAPNEDGFYDLRNIRFVDDTLPTDIGSPTLEDKLFVINWAVKEYDAVKYNISKKAEEETKKKEEAIYDTLLTLTPLEQKYAVEDAFIHNTYPLYGLSSYLNSLENTDVTRPAVINLLTWVTYYGNLKSAKKPAVIQEDKDTRLLASHAMNIKICSGFYHILKKSDKKTQKIILNSIWLNIGTSKYPWEPKRANVKYEIKEDMITISYKYTTNRSDKSYQRTYQFGPQTTVITDTSPNDQNDKHLTTTLTVKNGQVTGGSEATLNGVMSYLYLPELIDKVKTHVDALWQDPGISETKNMELRSQVYAKVKANDDFTKLLSLPTGQTFGVCEVKGVRPTQEDTIAYDAGPASKLFAALSEDDQKKVMQETFANLQKTCGQQSKEGSCLCAATGYVVGNQGTISTSYVGDSVSFLIILDKDKKVKKIKVCNPNLHNTKNDSEVKAVCEGNGRSKGLIYFNRLDGSLAVTRAIGDTQYEEKGLLHIPETTIVNFELDEGDYAFMVAGCDGVTEPFGYNLEAAAAEIGSLFAKWLEFSPNMTPARLAELIAGKILELGSQDNISVFVVPLAKPMPVVAELLAAEAIEFAPVTVVPIDGHAGPKVSRALRDEFNKQFMMVLEAHVQLKPDLIDSLTATVNHPQHEVKNVDSRTTTANHPQHEVKNVVPEVKTTDDDRILKAAREAEAREAEREKSATLRSQKENKDANAAAPPPCCASNALPPLSPLQLPPPYSPRFLLLPPNPANAILSVLKDLKGTNESKITFLVDQFTTKNEQTILKNISDMLCIAEQKESSNKTSLSAILTRIDSLIPQLKVQSLTADEKEILLYAQKGLEEVKTKQKMGLKIGVGLSGLVVTACIVVGLLMAGVATAGIAPVLICVAAAIVGLICMSPAAVSVYNNRRISKRLDSMATLLSNDSPGHKLVPRQG